MNQSLAQRTASRLRDAADSATSLAATVGLDAFVDEITRVVDRRSSPSAYTTIPTIGDLGGRIVSAAGQSTNLELVVERVKLGGNGPIMANALASLAPRVTCMGPLGTPDLHPAFQQMADHAELISLGQPAHTDALEFDDGKLMLGKLEPLDEVTWPRIVEVVGERRAGELFTGTDLVALVNWTMLPHMTDIWREILRILPYSHSGRCLYFFDLADPEKRDRDAIREACSVIGQFQQHQRVILGLNEKEAFLVAEAFGYTGGTGERSDVRAAAGFISRELPVHCVVVHPRAYAVAAKSGEILGDVDGPFTETPLISTGAGDHFNAGFCLAQLLGLSAEESLATGVGTSGYYVRNAESPSLDQLAQFLSEQ